MSSGLAESAGFVIQTPEEKPKEGDVDYSLLDNRLDEALSGLSSKSVLLLTETIRSTDPVARSMGLNRIPDALLLGVENGNLSNDEMDALRELWCSEMDNEDEDRRYEAQELFVLEEQRLQLQDRTSVIWLGSHITKEWFED